MRGKRLRITLRLMLMRSSVTRAEYLKKKSVFRGMGNNCSIMNRSLPLYPELIRLGNNVHIASNVGFVTHDITNHMLNRNDKAKSMGGVQPFTRNLDALILGIMSLLVLEQEYFTT